MQDAAGMTVKDLVQTWDHDGVVQSVEMGGIGPGYEQVIQIIAMELLRDYAGKTLPDEEDNDGWSEWGESTLTRLEYLHPSGAQVASAMNLAARILRIGYGAAIEEIKAIDSTRLIFVSKHFPDGDGDDRG